MQTSQLLQYIFTGLTLGSIYGMAALGFNIIYNSTGIINFAQGEFLMLGGMFAITFNTHPALLWPLPLAVLAAVVLTAVVGWLFELVVIRPVRGSNLMAMIIATIAGSILLKGIAMFAWGKQTLTLPSFSGDTPVQIGGAALSLQSVWVLATLLVVVMLLNLFFEHTIWGKAMRACACNRGAAQLMGIKARRMVTLSFVLSATIGALAGTVITPIAMMDYGRGTALGLKGFAAAILGGLGNGPGAILAGLLLGLIEAFTAAYVSSLYKDGVALLVLLLVLFFRPSGLIGKRSAVGVRED